MWRDTTSVHSTYEIMQSKVARVVLMVLYLKSSTQSQNKMQSVSRINVITGSSFFIRQGFAAKDQSLLRRGNSFFLLDPLFYSFYCISGFNVNLDDLSRQILDFNLHADRVQIEKWTRRGGDCGYRRVAGEKSSLRKLPVSRSCDWRVSNSRRSH